MPRIPLHPFMGGLWIAPEDRALTPPGMLRRTQGLSNIKPGSLQSRRGSVQLFTYPASGVYATTVPHSLFRFGGKTFAGVGEFVYRDSTPLITLLNGNPLAFVKAPKTVGIGDLLYIAGGGNLIKVDTSGAESPWGVPPPPDGFLANKLPYKQKAVPMAAVTLRPTNPLASTAQVFSPSVDFTTFDDTSASATGDYITLYVSATVPSDIDTIQIAFVSTPVPLPPDDTALSQQPYFLRKLSVTAATVDSQESLGITSNVNPLPVARGGVNVNTSEDIAAFQRFLTSGFVQGDLAHSATRQRRLLGTDRYGQPVYSYVEAPKTVVGGQSNIVITPATVNPNNAGATPDDNWTPLLIPKNTFISVPDASGNLPTWNKIDAIILTVSQLSTAPPSATNPYPQVTISPAPAIPAAGEGRLLMIGGSPITGTVKYRLTQVDNASGAESNPNPAYLDVILGQQTQSLSIMSTLTAPITAIAGTASVADATGFDPNGGKIRIDDEFIIYGGLTGNTLTGLQRGADQSFPSNHAQNAVVQFITEPTAFSVNRHVVRLERLPTPTAGTHLRLYRTLGNQELLFNITDLIDGTTPGYDAGAGIFLDDYADFSVLENPPHVIGTNEILFDNIKPDPSYVDAVGPHQGRIWWIDRTLNRLYYSPPGRWESTSNFIEITKADDPPQKLVEWQGQLFVVTKFRIIAIGGDTEPFSFQEVAGAPGTDAPFTVVPSTAGIFYKAKDGLRLFNGVQSALVGFDQVGPIFRGEARENINPFSPTVAMFGRDELWLSDTQQTLIYNIGNSWRQAGYGFNAFYYDEGADDLLGALALPTAPLTAATWALERLTAVTDAGNPIIVDWQTGGLSPAVDAAQLIQRLYIYARCNGQLLTPSLILDDAEIPLPAFTGTTPRNFEFSVNRNARVVGVRIQGNIVQPIEVARLELDIDEATQQ